MSHKSEEKMNTIDFKVPLSKSKLFDMNSYATAQKLCSKFPGLKCNMGDTHIHIWGELNDFWLEKWNKAVFSLGEIDIEE